jgi:hypothetical protein
MTILNLKKKFSNNDDVGQWKMPPEPKGRRRPDEGKSFMGQQKSSPGGGRHFSGDFEPFPESSNQVPFSMSFSRNLQQQQQQQQQHHQQRNNASALSDPIWEWHEGDKCMAKYWEDNRVRKIFFNF